MIVVETGSCERLAHALSPSAEASGSRAGGEIWVILVLAGGEESRDALDDFARSAVLVLKPFDDRLECARGDPLLREGVDASVICTTSTAP